MEFTILIQRLMKMQNFFPELSFNDAITKNLKVMDATALTLARDHNLPITVFNVNTERCIKRYYLR
jgi:uridylate kinase